MSFEIIIYFLCGVVLLGDMEKLVLFLLRLVVGWVVGSGIGCFELL